MRIYQVDAFTTQPFRGNPACVCLLDTPRTDDWLQAVAAEMNLSETAFLATEGERLHLRWFTPKREVSLCGHATLATAHVLWEQGLLPKDKAAAFDTKGGLLTARRQGNWIEMDFPARYVTSASENPALNRALGVTPLATSRRSSAQGETYLIEIESPETLRALQPDYTAMLRTDARVVIVTCRSTGGSDFSSRFFAPAIGIDEDPVTGSAHCYLAPYWSARLGKNEFVGYQASARGGVVGCRWEGERVLLRGQAITVMEGRLLD